MRRRVAGPPPTRIRPACPAAARKVRSQRVVSACRGRSPHLREGPCARRLGKIRGGPMALALNIGKCTLLGNYRENNEDSIEVKQFPDLTVSIVADGMGGQAAGEIASKRAIEVVPRELKKNLRPTATHEEAQQIIRKAIVQANEEIIAMGALDRDLRNMGTTIVMAIWRKTNEIYV